MHVTSTGIGVAIAVVVAMGFLLFGPRILAPFSNSGTQSASVASSTDATLGATPDTAVTGTAAMGTINSNSKQPSMDTQKLPTELSIKDEVIGTGAEAKAGTTVTVNYVGALPDGTVFDASKNHGQPFSFALGAGQVIKGWDKGVVGMKVGGKRLLVIPPADGYGSQSAGSIPPNSTLIFEVELLDVK
jgi:FKBP-type peptidyl-prolyl cis-trans isomerase